MSVKHDMNTEVDQDNELLILGQTMNHREFPTEQATKAFAKQQRKCGDVVYSVAEIVPDEGSNVVRGMLTVLAEQLWALKERDRQLASDNLPRKRFVRDVI